jgi:WD repeat-containing protein 19
MYESACTKNGDSKLPEDSSDALCIAGIAKTSLRLGDLRRGTNLAINSKDRQLCKECGDILKSMSQWQDAATVYEEGGRYEDAVKIYLKEAMNAAKVEPLMEKIQAPRLLKEYALLKQRQAEKETNPSARTKLFEKASEAFQRAKELDSVVMLQLSHLNNPELAFGIVRQTGSKEGALLVAEYCKKMTDYTGAIEFLLMAQKSEEAFQLAQAHDQMAVYAKALGDTIMQDEVLSSVVRCPLCGLTCLCFSFSTALWAVFVFRFVAWRARFDLIRPPSPRPPSFPSSLSLQHAGDRHRSLLRAATKLGESG